MLFIKVQQHHTGEGYLYFFESKQEILSTELLKKIEKMSEDADFDIKISAPLNADKKIFHRIEMQVEGRRKKFVIILTEIKFAFGYTSKDFNGESVYQSYLKLIFESYSSLFDKPKISEQRLFIDREKFVAMLNNDPFIKTERLSSQSEMRDYIFSKLT